MSKLMKILTSIVVIILIIIGLVIGTYYVSFKPQVATTPISQNVEQQEKELLKKFIPNKLDLSLTQLSADSTATLSDTDLTSLFIIAARQIHSDKIEITGVKAQVDGKYINSYIEFMYKGIPLEAKLVFEPSAQNGKGILHYVSGNVGFISIPKDLIFEKAIDNSMIQFDKSADNIILSFKDLPDLKIQSFQTKNNELEISFKATVNLWDWLK